MSITNVSGSPVRNRATELGCGTLGAFATGEHVHQAWHGDLSLLGRMLRSNGKDESWESGHSHCTVLPAPLQNSSRCFILSLRFQVQTSSKPLSENFCGVRCETLPFCTKGGLGEAPAGRRVTSPAVMGALLVPLASAGPFVLLSGDASGASLLCGTVRRGDMQSGM